MNSGLLSGLIAAQYGKRDGGTVPKVVVHDIDSGRIESSARLKLDLSYSLSHLVPGRRLLSHFVFGTHLSNLLVDGYWWNSGVSWLALPS